MMHNLSVNCYFVSLHGKFQYHYNFVEIQHKFTIAKLSICKLGSLSVLRMPLIKIRAYGREAL